MMICSIPLELATIFSSSLSISRFPFRAGGSLSAPIPLVSFLKSSNISAAGSVAFLSTTKWHTIDCLSTPAVSYNFDFLDFLTLRCTGSPCCDGVKSKLLSGFIVAVPRTFIGWQVRLSAISTPRLIFCSPILVVL